MMGAKNLVPAKYPRSLENCLCYPQKTMRVVATRVLRVCGPKSGSFSLHSLASQSDAKRFCLGILFKY